MVAIPLVSMLRLVFHIDLVPDPSLEGTCLARVRELPDVSTTLRSHENPIPIIESLMASYFEDMSQLGRLDEVLAGLGHAKSLSPPFALVAEYILHGEHEIRL
jgi:hypothetical protein